MNGLRVIGLTGPKYSGKDTAAKGLFKINSGEGLTLFRHAQMAKYAKSIAAYAFGFPRELNEDPVLKETPLESWPHKCPRELVIDVANWYRDMYGGTIWARRWELDALAATEWGAHVITDLRFPEEINMLRRLGGIIMYVQRDAAEEALAQKQQGGDVLANNVSESHYALMRKEADAILDNNGTIAQLHGQILAATRVHFGYWNQWGVTARYFSEGEKEFTIPAGVAQ